MNTFSLTLESAADQQARLEREEAERQLREARQNLSERIAKPLIGTRGDLGQRDLMHGGDLWAEREIV